MINRLFNFDVAGSIVRSAFKRLDFGRRSVDGRSTRRRRRVRGRGRESRGCVCNQRFACTLSLLTQEPAWDIGRLASWSLSSAKPNNGIDALRSPATDQYWQWVPFQRDLHRSDGPQPHRISILFPKRMKIKVILSGRRATYVSGLVCI
jgi:Anaphase-promoting complex, subunit 10 (APC10)